MGMQVNPKYWVMHIKDIALCSNGVLNLFPFRKGGTRLLMNLGYNVAKVNGKMSCP